MEESITKDLELTQEVVFASIALNPGKTAEELRDTLNFSRERMQEVVDTLLDEGLVDMRQDADSDLVWTVTEKGRVVLMKYVYALRHDIMLAELDERPVDEVKELKDLKSSMENAYKQCKVLFEDE